MTRPSVFVGSSSEGLEFARAVRGALTDDAEVTVWNEDFFDLGQTFIEGLTGAVAGFDFAILVLTPDDLVASRNVEGFGPRDNVIFEVGLFMGAIGRDRTFILRQADESVKIPSDLAGVMTARFDWPRTDDSHVAAVGSACDGIRRRVRSLGISEAKAGKEVREIASRQNEQGQALSRQHAEIRSLQIALRGIVTQYEYEKLTGLSGERPFLCRYSPELVEEIKRLRAMNLIRNQDGVGTRTIAERYRDIEFDLKDFFYITEEGREYLKLRSELGEFQWPDEESVP